MSLWLDCSSSYSVVPTPQQVADLKALGFEGAIIGSSYKQNHASHQIAAYRMGGMRVEEYQFPSAVRPLGTPWWVDAELPDATLAALRNTLRNGSCGPYTRRGWAMDNLPGWNCKAEFPDAELWDARYVHGDGPCVIAGAVERGDGIAMAIATERSWLSPFTPYWGFERAKVTQWHNSITICGVNMDLNEYEEDEMDADSKARFAQEAALRMLAGAALDDDMAALVAKLCFLGVLPGGTLPLKPHLVT